MADEPERHDVGETHPERVEREEGVADVAQGKWRRDQVLIAALLIGLTTVGWYTTGKFADDLRDSAVDGCERQNEVRAAFRADLRDDILGVQEEIEASRATDPALFPDIPRQKFRALVEKGVERDQARIARKRSRISNLIDTNCEAAYPG